MDSAAVSSSEIAGKSSIEKYTLGRYTVIGEAWQSKDTMEGIEDVFVNHGVHGENCQMLESEAILPSGSSLLVNFRAP